MGSRIETAKPRHRVVMLGASNLVRAFPTAVFTSINALGGPLDVFAAMGHGRSYARDSGCFGKKTSNIFSCGIWDALEAQTALPTTAWITDIGNDLAYEVPVETLLESIAECVDRLLSHGAKVVVSDLPLNVLQRVGTAKFFLFRTLLFPHCRLTLTEILDRAYRVSEGLRKMAESTKTTVFIGESDWYGFDPIHPRRATLEILWSQLLAAAGAPIANRPAVTKSWRRDRYLRSLQPESWSQFSIARRAPQPNGRLSDGTTISLY